MSFVVGSTPEKSYEQNTRFLLYCLSLATFLIFFETYMVAPLIPVLSEFFHISEQTVGLIVPAFLVPYGVFSLFYGIFADRFGTKKVILVSFFLFAILTIGTIFSRNIPQMIVWRLFAGIGAGGVIPISLAWIGQVYPYEKRGKPIGYIFGAVAGGGAFGAFAGALLEDYFGWKNLFTGVGVLSVILLGIIVFAYSRVEVKVLSKGVTIKKVFAAYRKLLTNPRGRNAYFYVLLNGIFISGVYTWIAVYLQNRFGLSGRQIAFALLGYGIPGLIFGPLIGKVVDHFGRSRLIPLGLFIGAASAFALIFPVSLWTARIAIIVLSLGFDLTQPLFAGIISEAGKDHGGQAMSFMALMLFGGFGLGSYLFGLALNLSMKEALIIFSIVQFLLAVLSLSVFRKEVFDL